jgi:hypothetical protein
MLRKKMEEFSKINVNVKIKNPKGGKEGMPKKSR